MQKVKYIFWDSDNTLVDTFALHWAKIVHVLNSHGIDIPESNKRRMHKNNAIQNWEWLSAELGLAVPQEQYFTEIDAYYFQNSHTLKLREGVAEALALFQKSGLKQCVVSNGRRNSVLISHTATSITNFFEFVLAKEDYEGRKPDPAPYLAALKKMSDIEGREIPPNECLAIEDDPLGAESAKRAGMAVLFRPTELTEQTSEFADYTVTNKDDFLKIVLQFA